MVYVKVSETYDLSTQTNKMALLALHTPKTSLIQKTYPGLAMNTKYCRIDHMNVVLACASLQSADPLQVGTEAGTIAPEDLFNPILYKAVTNDSLSTIEARMEGLYAGPATTINGNMVDVDNEKVTGLADDFSVYYSLLANRDGFRAANPQQGLSMTNLKPFVFSINYTSGNISATPGYSSTIYENGSGNIVHGESLVSSFRGGAKPMPRFPTSYITGSEGSGTIGTNFQWNGMGNGRPANAQIKMPNIPTIYTALIIVPPSRLHKLFYRLQVETVIEFSEVRPIQDITNFEAMSTDYFPEVYYRDYSFESKNSMVDADNADIKQVM